MNLGALLGTHGPLRHNGNSCLFKRPSRPKRFAICFVRRPRPVASVRVVGNDSKSKMAGPVEAADLPVSTSGLRRVLDYEPRDLTISVEAGYLFADLQKLLGQNGQMIALDPPFSERATVGGLVATNTAGPMRRAYGTARDVVIGMSFAALDGNM